MRQRCLDFARGLDESQTVVSVFFDTRRDRENIGVENDIGRIHTDFLGQDFVTAFANINFAFDRVGLPGFIKRHYDDGRTVVSNELGLPDERLFTFLQTDRINDGLALHTLESGLDNRPL